MKRLSIFLFLLATSIFASFSLYISYEIPGYPPVYPKLYNPLETALCALHAYGVPLELVATRLKPPDSIVQQLHLSLDHSLQSSNSFAQRHDNFKRGMPTSAALAMHEQFHGPPAASYIPQTPEEMVAYKLLAPYIPQSRDGTKRLKYVGSRYEYFYIMSNQQIHEQYKQLDRYQDLYASDTATIQQHQARRRAHLQESYSTQPELQFIHLDQPTKHFLRECNLPFENFSMIFGNQAQRALQYELCHIINHTSKTYYDSPAICKPACKDIAEIANIGMEANWAGQLVYGYCIADWCYSALSGIKDVAIAVGQGLIEGTYDLCKYANEHRIETIFTLACPKLALVYHGLPLVWNFLQLTGHVGSLAYKNLVCQDPSAQQQWQELMSPLKETYDHLHSNTWHLRWDTFLAAVKCGSKFATQVAIERKINNQFFKLFHQAESALLQAAKEKCLDAVKKYALPHGQPIHIAQHNGRIVIHQTQSSIPSTPSTPQPPPHPDWPSSLPPNVNELSTIEKIEWSLKVKQADAAFIQFVKESEGYLIKSLTGDIVKKCKNHILDLSLN